MGNTPESRSPRHGNENEPNIEGNDKFGHIDVHQKQSIIKEVNNISNETYVKKDKIKNAMYLPTVLNLNPRSVYNKKESFETFVKEHQIDVVFMSESFERVNMPLNELITLDNYSVLSNPCQRIGMGGRPALVINNLKYEITNLTNTLISIPWGVEAVWATIRAKNSDVKSKIKRIVLCSFYSKPNSNKKSLLLDNFHEAYNIICAKFSNEPGLKFMFAGDSNDLNLNKILNLSPDLHQLVKSPTRLNPPAILDPIITNLGAFYQPPESLPPLEPDSDMTGEPSDHCIVIMKPLDSLNTKCAREYREIRVRPMTKKGLSQLENWFSNQTWAEILNIKDVNKKASLLHEMILEKVELFLPEKTIKFASDDQPWYSKELKSLDHKRRREYAKNRKSTKYIALKKLYDKKVKFAKSTFKKSIINDTIRAGSHEWYKKFKRMSNYDTNQFGHLKVSDIDHLSPLQQAEEIANKFSSISQEFEPIKLHEIKIPSFGSDSIPVFRPPDIGKKLHKIKLRKATASGDIPPKIIRKFANSISVPLCDIINSSIKEGIWPEIYKIEAITPIPKVFPVKSVTNLRPISILYTFDKIMESVIGELVINDMSATSDKS